MSESVPAAGTEPTPAVSPTEPTLWTAPTTRQPGAAFAERRARPDSPAPPPVPAPPVTGTTPGPGDVTAVLDHRGVVVSISANCESVLGFSREELMGVPAQDLIHPEDRATLTSALRAFSSGITDHLHSVQRLRHKQVGYTLVETALRSSGPVAGQRPAGAMVLIRAPQASPAGAGLPTVSMAPAPIGTAYAWVMHGSRRAVIASADPVFASLLRTTTASLVGRPIEEVTDPDNREVGVARFLALLDGGSATYQVERLVDHGQALVELTVSLLPLLDKPGHMAVIQARDVSRQRELEQAVQDSLSELQRSNRELEAFASVAAHDLAAPLRVVVGYAEMLTNQDEHVNPQIAELLGKVASTSRRMQAQVDGLMTLARVEGEELTMGSYDVRLLVDEAMESLEDEIAHSGARIQVGPLPVASCNATGVVQVFQNLISNAIKYGGQKPMVNVESMREPTAWRCTVSDRGIGLPDCEEQDLFELFERGGGGHDGTPGAGIGLSVCRRIVERHGGRIWCNQRPGGGSEFHFTVPDPQPAVEPPNPARTRFATAAQF